MCLSSSTVEFVELPSLIINALKTEKRTNTTQEWVEVKIAWVRGGQGVGKITS